MTNSDLILVLPGTGRSDRRRFPPEVAAGLGQVFAAVLGGRTAAPTGGVAETLGRPPRDLTEFAAAAWGSG